VKHKKLRRLAHIQDKENLVPAETLLSWIETRARERERLLKERAQTIQRLEEELRELKRGYTFGEP